MNILFLSTHLNTGGITSYLFTLTKGMIRRGHHVHVISSGGNMEKEFLSVGANLFTLNIRTKSELSPKIYCALKSTARYIQDNNIDVIHAHTRITQVMGAWLKKMTRRPFLTTCHGFFKTRLSRKLIPCWGDFVIAISEAVQRHLVDDFNVSPKKIVLIKSGVDLDDFTHADEKTKLEYRKQYSLGNAPIVGMIARLSNIKGPDILIESFKSVLLSIPDAQLLLVGEGKMEEALYRMVDRLDLNGHVHFFPVVNKTNEMLPLFDIFVMPSRQEGLGLSIMEAQAACLPVIASRVGGIPSLIEDGKTGILVEPENREALADAIVTLMNDKNRLRTIAMAGRDFIAQKHSANTMIDKTIELYHKWID